MSLWHDLIKTYGQHSIDAPGLKVITLAQWALESAFGTSPLAQDHLNFGGLKFRARVNLGRENNPLATPVDYMAHDGEDTYCAFGSLEDFIDGYWAFIDNTTIYGGWHDEAEDPSGYINLLRSRGYAQDPNYVAKVLAVVPRIRREIDELGYAQLFSSVDMSPGTKRKVAVVRGHNSSSKGAYSDFLGSSEWDFNRRIFQHMHRASDEYELELREFLRPPGMSYADEIATAYSEADAWEPEIIIETHFNSADPTGHGTEMLYWGTSTTGEKIARAVQQAVLDEFGLPDRGIKGRTSGRGSTSLKASRYPTILTEPFFGSSQSDCAKILNHGEDALARAYLIGLRDALDQI
mmetsp:Transcript_22993/g.38819  ORF Transcript_22993/g.38819 Transcript_22993/m.38819 type:complete len:350 (-) Transcript_22993:188-1237(-)